MARIFEPYLRRSLGSILKYVPRGATKKKAKKASHMGEFILILGLTLLCRLVPVCAPSYTKTSVAACAGERGVSQKIRPCKK